MPSDNMLIGSPAVGGVCLVTVRNDRETRLHYQRESRDEKPERQACDVT